MTTKSKTYKSSVLARVAAFPKANEKDVAGHTNAMKQHCRGVVKRHPIVDGPGTRRSR